MPAPLARLLRAPDSPSKWLTMLAVCLGLGMLMIDTFVVNVAFPAIGRDLQASLSTAEWTVSGYVLVLGVLPLAMGRLGDIFGRRRIYLAGLVVFISASMVSGLAPDIRTLIAARVLQGAGAAVMMPGTLSIITHAFPARQRGLAIGVWGGVSGLGLIAGPILGGLLVRGDQWRWIFWINAPVGVAALIMAVLFVAESRDTSAPRKVDWPGVALLAASLGLVMFGITQGNDQGWASPAIVACFVAGVAFAIAFLLVETRAPVPLVHLALFRRGTFVMACLSAFLFSAAVFGSQPYTSLFMQNSMGFSPLQAGFAFIPSPAIVATLMPVSGMLGQRLGPRLRVVVIAGSLLVACSFLYTLRMEPGSTYTSVLLPAFILRGMGIGLVMSATSLAVMNSAPVAMSGLASGTLTMFRQVGTALGVALFGAVFLHHVHSAIPDATRNLPPDQSARVVAAAEHFVAAGPGDTRAEADRIIVDGFVLVAAYGVLVTAVATASAFFIRPRRLTPEAAEAPAPVLAGEPRRTQPAK